MPVYKKREIEGKDMRVTVRLSADEVSTFDRMVKQVGAGSRSELMRLMMHNYVYNGAEAQVAEAPTVQMNADELLDLKFALDNWCVNHEETYKQLKGIATNINQIAKDSHTGVADADRLNHYLVGLNEFLADLANAYKTVTDISEVVDREYIKAVQA